MKSVRTPLLAALLLSLIAPWTFAADDAAQFRLTPALLDRIDAIQAESERLDAADEQDEGDDDEEDEGGDDADDIDAVVRRIEADPQIRTVLTRHGVAPREFALAMHALLHAGTFLAFESAMEKQGAERLLAGYTPTQRANIEVVRQRVAAKK